MSMSLQLSNKHICGHTKFEAWDRPLVRVYVYTRTSNTKNSVTTVTYSKACSKTARIQYIILFGTMFGPSRVRYRPKIINNGNAPVARSQQVLRLDDCSLHPSGGERRFASGAVCVWTAVGAAKSNFSPRRRAKIKTLAGGRR